MDRRGLKSTFLVLALALLATTGVSASVVLTNSDPTALMMAIEQAGTVILAFDGSVALTNTLVIATNTTVDATRHDVILEGQGINSSGYLMRVRRLSVLGRP